MPPRQPSSAGRSPGQRGLTCYHEGVGHSGRSAFLPDLKPTLLLRLFDSAISALEALGVGGPRWLWRKQNWRRRLEERIATQENLARGTRVRNRMCPECRALVPRRSRICPECGVPLHRPRRPGSGSWLDVLFPASGNLSLALVTANFAVFLLMLATWGPAAEGRGMFGILSPPGAALFAFGAKWGPAIELGQPWRLVTALFLHSGIVHLLFNCYALANLGPLIENSFGRRKFFLIYMGTGIASFLASTIFSPRALSVGCSGAIFGLLGFAVVYGRFRGGAAGREIAAQLMRWVIMGVLLFFMPGIDSAAHFGGLATGAALGLVLDVGEPRSAAADRLLWLFTTAAVLILLGSFAAMLLSYGANVATISGG